MAQKIISIGSSMGVVLPKPIADQLGLVLGQEVSVTVEGLDRVVIDRKPSKSENNDRSTDLVKWAAAYVEKYRKDFEALADK